MSSFPTGAFNEKFRWLLRLLSSARVFALSLLWLMVILIAGTIAVKTDGLYAAEQRYFSSYVVWIGKYMPLPGLLSVSVFIFVGLIARLARENWRWKNLGTIVIHIGAALLLAGGFVTSLVSREGAMVIPQGEAINYMEDARLVELAISELRGNDIVSEMIVPEADMAKGRFGNLPFAMDLVSWCRNCGLQRLPAPVVEGNPHGVAINFILKDIPRAPDDDKNRAGMTFRVRGTKESDGLYAIFQDMPIPEVIAVEGKKYWLSIRPARSYLPFAIRLQKFTEELYPGTNKPRAYQSDIVVKDGEIAWPATIRMNEPLRYKGYTFYQSSFAEGGALGTTTILAVVKNAGRLFPYLSSVVLALGFVVHLVQRLILRKRKIA